MANAGRGGRHGRCRFGDTACSPTSVPLARRAAAISARRLPAGGGQPIAASQPAALYPENPGPEDPGQGQAGAGGGGASNGSSSGGSGSGSGNGPGSGSGSGASSGGGVTRSAAAKADE